MAIELVTGKKGTVHVDSADDGALYAAIAGKGEYVLDLDDRLACTMTTANKAHVASGHGLMQGRHWLIDAEGVDLTIQNGTQGQKRNDLIVARYECDAKNGNVESVALKVIKGTPTTGTPADPARTHGDILEGDALVNEQPLWRIPLNGITVGTPVRLFEVLTPAKDAWDSVCHVKTGTVTRTGTGTNYVQLMLTSDLNAILGSSFGDVNPTIAVCNGDWPAAQIAVLGAAISVGEVVCNLGSILPTGQTMRINYAVIWP